MKPLARTKGFVVRDLSGELIVYDLDRHEAHCLNATAAVVFRHADGQHTPGQIAAHLGVSGRGGTDVVDMALEQLAGAGLLEHAPPPDEAGLSRRDVVRRVGLGAAVLLPLVTSVLAPTAAEAAATCVESCFGEDDLTPCTCFGEAVCTAECVGGACSVGGC
jgi:hypothetical protein